MESALARLAARLLMVATYVPPDGSGGVVVPGRVFRTFDPRDYCLVHFATADSPVTRSSHALPAHVHRVARRLYRTCRGRSAAPLAQARAIRWLTGEAYQRAEETLRVVRK